MARSSLTLDEERLLKRQVSGESRARAEAQVRAEKAESTVRALDLELRALRKQMKEAAPGLISNLRGGSFSITNVGSKRVIGAASVADGRYVSLEQAIHAIRWLSGDTLNRSGADDAAL